MVNPSELETLDAPRLRELTRELVEQLSAQQHENHQRAQSIESLKRELLFKSTRIEQLSYELARYKRLRFARSSEALNGVQASLLAEALDCDLAAIEEQLEQLRERPKSAATHRPRREALPAHLPRVAVHHEPEVKTSACLILLRFLEALKIRLIEIIDLYSVSCVDLISTVAATGSTRNHRLQAQSERGDGTCLRIHG